MNFHSFKVENLGVMKHFLWGGWSRVVKPTTLRKPNHCDAGVLMEIEGS